MKRFTIGLMAMACAGTLPVGAADRPNIILVMVDDMGFSDVGCYGGEIRTPTIDALAAGGVRFSRFYNSSRCCPTRASLMTGLHPHLTGIGHMTNPPHTANHDAGPAFPNYRGFLNRECVTLAELLRPAGYATLMAGKWHLGFNQPDRWPLQRGFEQFYGCLSGATRYFHPEEPRHMTTGNQVDAQLKSTTDRPFYTTDAFTDHAIRLIRDERSGQRRPFFLYLAYTAPHWPHQAHEHDIAAYRGTYLAGWDHLRGVRYRRQVTLGLVDPGWKLSPRDGRVPAWDTLTADQQDEMDLRMAVYAAMIDRVDQNLEKLVNELKSLGVFDNTLILFLSDNGGCAEGPVLGRGEIMDPERRNREHANNYGVAWANFSNTPFRLYKHFTHEGGAATPFLMSWPARIQPRSGWYDEPAQLIDVMPTLLDITGVGYPDRYAGHALHPLRGISLVPAFDGLPLKRSAPMFSEHENNAFMMDGDWKLVGRAVSVPGGPDPKRWELYNLRLDRTELDDLAAREPARLQAMAARWAEWARADKVYPKPGKKPSPGSGTH